MVVVVVGYDGVGMVLPKVLCGCSSSCLLDGKNADGFVIMGVSVVGEVILMCKLSGGRL